MNQPSQTSAFIKIRGDPSSIKNVTIHTGEWGNSSLSDEIN